MKHPLSCPRRRASSNHGTLDDARPYNKRLFVNTGSSAFADDDSRVNGSDHLQPPTRRLQRREFIALLGGAAASSMLWPLATRAQPAKLPTIGFLVTGTRSSHGQWFATLALRLRELGWIEGRTIAIEYRWGEGRSERFAEIAAEFVRRKVDVIVTGGSAVLAAKQATAIIPIVFATASDPVGGGYVTSLARPGGNVTGMSQQRTETAGKRLELLREVVPGLRRLAIMSNVGNPGTVLEMGELQKFGGKLGLEVVTLKIRRAADIAPAFDALKGRADALYVCSDPLVAANRVRINTLALAARLPTMHGFREYVEGGGLMSYGPNFRDLYWRAAELVDKILRGTKPADIPVEQPTKFDLVINLTTAKALGLTIPPMLLARADEVIE
jgi:putative ABC transport system substrate-binding protein